MVGNPLPEFNPRQRVSIEGFIRARHLSGTATQVVVNSYPSFGPYLLRLCLHANSERIIVVGTWREVTKLRRKPSNELIALKYEEARYKQADNAAILALEAAVQDPESGRDAVFAGMLSRSSARLASAWRESLIRYFRRQHNVPITKNEARRAVGDTRIGYAYARSYMVELPEAVLAELANDIDPTIETLRWGAVGAGDPPMPRGRSRPGLK